ncbi:MAG: hypothetical protein ABSF36_07685 [Candidatus Methanomethylicaceae archaeon]|jgi:hypothetical protein
MTEYHGIIIDKSLRNKKLIEKLNVIGSRRSSTGLVLLKISFPAEELGKMIKLIQENLVIKEKYYAHFYRDDELVVIFKDRIFRISPEKSSWKPVIDYGLSLKIPIKQLDMKPCRFEDETY